MDAKKWQALARKYPTAPIANDAGEIVKARTTIVRLAFEEINTPKTVKGAEAGKSDKKYSCALIFPPDADMSVLEALADGAAADKFGAKAKTMRLASPFKRQADATNQKTGERYEGMSDSGVYINATSWFKPSILSPTNEEIEPTPDVLYSGMYVRATVSAAGYEAEGKKGVTFRLAALQIVAKGERFAASAPDASTYYDALNPADFDEDDAPAAAAAAPVTPPKTEPVRTPNGNRWM